MSNEELMQIKDRVEKATAGPWKSRKDGTVFLEHTQDIANVCTVNGDAEFIAHAREDVPRLVAEVERLQADNQRLIDELKKADAFSEDIEQKLFVAKWPEIQETIEILSGKPREEVRDNE